MALLLGIARGQLSSIAHTVVTSEGLAVIVKPQPISETSGVRSAGGGMTHRGTVAVWALCQPTRGRRPSRGSASDPEPLSIHCRHRSVNAVKAEAKEGRRAEEPLYLKRRALASARIAKSRKYLPEFQLPRWVLTCHALRGRTTRRSAAPLKICTMPHVKMNDATFSLARLKNLNLSRPGPRT